MSNRSYTTETPAPARRVGKVRAYLDQPTSGARAMRDMLHSAPMWWRTDDQAETERLIVNTLGDLAYGIVIC